MCRVTCSPNHKARMERAKFARYQLPFAAPGHIDSALRFMPSTSGANILTNLKWFLDSQYRQSCVHEHTPDAHIHTYMFD